MKLLACYRWIPVLAATIGLAACSGNNSNSASNQKGGSIQGKPLFLTGTVTTLAGKTPFADGTGAAAGFNHPAAIATDGTNLYVADTGNSTIRKVVIATGKVSTMAGIPGEEGTTDGIGSAARLNNPYGITTDGTNLYVADTSNCTIRKIVISTAVVTTIAGKAGVQGSDDGIGAAASFRLPTGIATDGTNLFVTDYYDNTIRKVVISTGEVTTLAGAPGVIGAGDGIGATASFSGPFGITTDGTNLYVTDSFNTIRKIVIATGEVSTLAGTPGVEGFNDGIGPAASFHQPEGITTDGTYLYVSDSANNAIRKIVISTGAVSTLTSCLGTRRFADDFYFPKGIVIAGTDLYVTETYYDSIRKIAIASGNMTTLAGSNNYADGTGPTASFNEPCDLTTDGRNLYVADSGSKTIRKIVIATGKVTTLAGTPGTWGSNDGVGPAASFDSPLGITTDGTSLFVTDSYNCTIRKIVIATGEVTTLAGSQCLSSSSDGTGTAASFMSPTGITTDGTNLYVADTASSTIRKVVIASGEVTTLAGSPDTAGSSDGTGTAAGFYFPYGITCDGTNLFVTDFFANTIRKIVIASREVSTLAGLSREHGSSDGVGTSARFSFPLGITTDGSSLYVVDSNNHNVRKIVIANGEVTTLADISWVSANASGGRFDPPNFPRGITTDGVSLFVADTANNTIRKIH